MILEMQTIESKTIEAHHKLKSHMVHNRVAMSNPGSFFLDMVKLSCHIAEFDGITDSGRIKTRALTPQETVTRAVEITELAFTVIDNRKWALITPSVETFIEEKQEMTGFTRGEK